MQKEEELAGFGALDANEVFAKCDSSSKGLSSEEAEERLRKFGRNVLVEKKKFRTLRLFLSRFKNALIIILVIAAMISAYFGELLNAAIIVGMILLSAVLDFFLEYRAEKASEKLKENLKIMVDVMRDNKKIEIRASEICVGDVIFLNAGDIIPADARVISAKDFFVNQATLTGESMPVEKTAEKTLLENKLLTELTNILFMGTNVISGVATAVVIQTGRKTEFGKIAEKLAAPEPETSFDKGIKDFGYLLTKIIIFLVLFIFLINAVIKHDYLQSFLFAVAVAVGLTPELLPMIMSVTMARGALNMAKKGVIVKRLAAIPNFGSMDILCTDKTGTLTEDKIQVIKHTDIFGTDSDQTLLYAYLNSFYQTGIQNPLDDALLRYKKFDVGQYKKIDEIPFSFAKKRMSVVVTKGREIVLITKGAPEEIFKHSTTYYSNGKKIKLTAAAQKKATRVYYDLSSEGFKVLAVAIKKVSSKTQNYEAEDSSDLELVGFVSFLDPPRKDVSHVLHEMNELGIEIKVITGDNEFVTKKICSEIGLTVKGMLLGSEIDALSDASLQMKAEETTIFARFTPEQKNRVIRALQARGNVVGFLGDGINDAPSLKAADVGISVKSAVDVAKESADITLTRKNLEELKEGVVEGRKSFGNTMKYIMMGLSSNFGNMFSVSIAAVFLPFLPMLPVQILLNNFIYDASQVTITTDNVDKEFIKKPKHWDIKFIKKFMIVFGLVSSVFDIITFFILFQLPEPMFQTGWFIESLATQALVIHVIRTRQTPFVKSRASKALLITTLAGVVIGWILPFTIVGTYFGFQPLPMHLLAIIAGLVIIYLVIVEITKRIFYKKNNF